MEKAMAEDFQESSCTTELNAESRCHKKPCHLQGCVEALLDIILNESEFNRHLIDYMSTGMMFIKISNVLI